MLSIKRIDLKKISRKIFGKNRTPLFMGDMSTESTYKGDMFKFPEKIDIYKKGVILKKNFWKNFE